MIREWLDRWALRRVDAMSREAVADPEGRIPYNDDPDGIKFDYWDRMAKGLASAEGQQFLYRVFIMQSIHRRRMLSMGASQKDEIAMLAAKQQALQEVLMLPQTARKNLTVFSSRRREAETVEADEKTSFVD